MPSTPKNSSREHASRRAASGATVASSKIVVPGNTGVKITRACTILKPAAELYAFWRNLENLVLVIKHPATIGEAPHQPWIMYRNPNYEDVPADSPQFIACEDSLNRKPSKETPAVIES